MSQDNFCRLESFRWLFYLTWKLLANLDLLQVDLTSLLASGGSFFRPRSGQTSDEVEVARGHIKSD